MTSFQDPTQQMCYFFQLGRKQKHSLNKQKLDRKKPLLLNWLNLMSFLK